MFVDYYVWKEILSFSKHLMEIMFFFRLLPVEFFEPLASCRGERPLSVPGREESDATLRNSDSPMSSER